MPNALTTIDATAFAGCGNVTLYCAENSAADVWAAGQSNVTVVYQP